MQSESKPDSIRGMSSVNGGEYLVLRFGYVSYLGIDGLANIHVFPPEVAQPLTYLRATQIWPVGDERSLIDRGRRLIVVEPNLWQQPIARTF
jgi:uncharacterized membrane protein